METPSTAAGKPPILQNGPGLDKGFGVIPEALSSRRKAISLSEGGVIVAEKWSAQKLILILDFAATAFNGLSASSLTGLDGKSTAVAFIRILGDRVLGLVELSVRAEDRPKVATLDADELLDVLDAVLELNLTEKLTKKVQSLMGRLKPLSTAGVPTTPLK